MLLRTDAAVRSALAFLDLRALATGCFVVGSSREGEAAREDRTESSCTQVNVHRESLLENPGTSNRPE
jgi:hypothetical protein